MVWSSSFSIALLTAMTRPVITGISWLSGRTIPLRVSRLLSSLRTTTRLPMGSITSNSDRFLVGFVAMYLLYRPKGCRAGVPDLPLAGFGQGFGVPGDRGEDRMQPQALEDIADRRAGFGEDQLSRALLGRVGRGEEHREGGSRDHFHFGEIDQCVAGRPFGELLEHGLDGLEAFHGEASNELHNGDIAQFGAFQGRHWCLVSPHAEYGTRTGRILPNPHSAGGFSPGGISGPSSGSTRSCANRPRKN